MICILTPDTKVNNKKCRKKERKAIRKLLYEQLRHHPTCSTCCKSFSLSISFVTVWFDISLYISSRCFFAACDCSCWHVQLSLSCNHFSFYCFLALFRRTSCKSVYIRLWEMKNKIILFSPISALWSPSTHHKKQYKHYRDTCKFTVRLLQIVQGVENDHSHQIKNKGQTND